MRANTQFLNMPAEFWAAIGFISQNIGYTDRKNKTIKIPTKDEILTLYNENNFHISNESEYTIPIINYFKHRSNSLNYVKSKLMNLEEAKETYNNLSYNNCDTNIPLPYNKQKGEKRQLAYFTCIINTLISKALTENYGPNVTCNYDPRQLPVFTKDGIPVATLSRRVDGCYPNVDNPCALWEIKEYYYTTTFGSRIADSIYETALDGYELKKVYNLTNSKVFHYLMIDSYNTWWEQGRSYLCRLVDLLHMGLVDEVLFGKEVVDRIPDIVSTWQCR